MIEIEVHDFYSYIEIAGNLHEFLEEFEESLHTLCNDITKEAMNNMFNGVPPSYVLVPYMDSYSKYSTLITDFLEKNRLHWEIIHGVVIVYLTEDAWKEHISSGRVNLEKKLDQFVIYHEENRNEK